MLCTSAKAHRRHGQRGFTLVELLTAALISLIVFAALFSAYIYIARNITRISLAHQQSLQNSRILHLFANDVGAAAKVISASNQSLILQFPDATQATYTYNPADLTLQRVAPSGTTILNGITPLPLGFSTPAYSSNIFNYYNQAGTSMLPIPGSYPPPLTSVSIVVDIRQIELSFLSTAGVASSGTRASTSVISSRMDLRGKMPLGQ